MGQSPCGAAAELLGRLSDSSRNGPPHPVQRWRFGGRAAKVRSAGSGFYGGGSAHGYDLGPWSRTGFDLRVCCISSTTRYGGAPVQHLQHE
jgi:hypothetical protein